MNDSLTTNLKLTPSQLYVSDLDKLIDYYHKFAGLELLDSSTSKTVLGHKSTPILELVSKSKLPFAASGTAGLFHNAILFESKGDLSKSILGLATHAPETFSGTGDHLVSEAFYFTDPEGNGLELYVDRPSEDWTWRNNQVQMDTLYIDPNQFLEQHLNDPANKNVKLGHVHLRVGDISQARKFYIKVLGFDITALLPGAMFMSVAGYHHHIAVNTWQSYNAKQREITLGLSEINIKLDSKSDVDRLANRLEKAGWKFTNNNQALQVADPWGNKLSFRHKTT